MSNLLSRLFGITFFTFRDLRVCRLISYSAKMLTELDTPSGGTFTLGVSVTLPIGVCFYGASRLLDPSPLVHIKL